jgi:hypothetical protein
MTSVGEADILDSIAIWNASFLSEPATQLYRMILTEAMGLLIAQPHLPAQPC